MILVDTSVWVDHLRRGDAHLVELLHAASALMHPFIVGELACGNLRQRKSVLELLQGLPTMPVAEPDEVLYFIDQHHVAGQGIGYVDAHLLAAVKLTPGTRLWTRDKRLLTVAAALGCLYKQPPSQ